MSSIQCCHHCTRPWKTPLCHTYCPVYCAEKEQHDRKMAEINRIKRINAGLNDQRTEAVERYRRRKGVKQV